MNKLVNKIFLRKYKGKDEEIYFQARALTYILLGLTFLFTLLLFIMKEQNTMFYLLGIVIANIFLLLLIRTGFHKIAGVITVVFLSILLVFMIFIRDFEDTYEVYFMNFLLLSILVMTLFISSKNFHVIMVMVISTLSTIYEFFFRALPAKLDGKTPDIDDYVISIVMIVISGFIIIGFNRRGKRLLKAIEDESRANKKRAAGLEDILKGLEKDFDTGSLLIDSSAQVGNFVGEIQDKMKEIRDRMDNLIRNSTGLRKASTAIAASSNQVSSAVEEQTAIIEQSSSAVTEMAGAIESISLIASKRKSTIINLSTDSVKASEAMNESSQSMMALKKSVSALEEVNEVINTIANQTGLLAMNAAIEAAHAGDSGKGFAVVADEIRKLSEESVENVQIIAGIRKEISGAANSAEEINHNASTVYSKIHNEIGFVIRGMDEIIQGISELSVGTREINKGTAQSVDSTSQVKNGVTLVNREIQEITNEISGLEQATESVFSSVEATLLNLGRVREETTRINRIGQENAKNLQALREKLSLIGEEKNRETT